MSEIPEWQYPLYKKSDKAVYLILEKLGKSKKYPQIIGSQKEINDLLKLMLTSQKTKNYRQFRDVIINELKKQRITIKDVLKEGRKIKISKGIDNSWVIFTQDKRICELIDDVGKIKMDFQGSNNEIIEFIVRFWLSQLLQDWRGPLMAVLIECSDNERVDISKLNDLLKIWDYTKIF